MLEPLSRLPWREPGRDQWQRELKFAAQVQEALLGARGAAGDGIEAFGCSLPHFAVGGDYFDLIELGNGKMRLVVADVMGKGFGAGMLMAMLRSAVRIASPHQPSPGELLTFLNGLLYDDLQRVGSFITASCADYDPVTRTVRLASAGAPYPLLQQSGQAAQLIKVRGVALGLLPSRVYPEQEVSVRPSDLLCLYTDGIVEARDQAGAYLTVEGLKRLIAEGCNCGTEQVVKRVLAGITAHTGGVVARDDLTLIAAKF